MNRPTPDPHCPDCKGSGIISRPYMMGMKGGDLYAMTACGCRALARPTEGEQE